MKKNLNGLILKENPWKDCSFVEGVMTNQIRGNYNYKRNSSKNGYFKKAFRYERV
jgi:hypothetical protein